MINKVEINKTDYLLISSLLILSFSPLLSDVLKFIILLALTSMLLVSKIDIVKSKLLILFSMYLLIGITILVEMLDSTNNFSELYIYLPISLFLGLLITEYYPEHVFLKIIENIVYWIAIFSLFGLITITIYPSLINILPSYEYYGTVHKTAYLFNILLNQDGGYISRITGIAWEPGVFQLLLNLSLYNYLKENKKYSIFKLLVYIVSIFLTKSTIGLFIMFLILLIMVKKSKEIRYIIIILLLFLFKPLSEEIMFQVENKLNGSYSFNIRIEPLINAMKYGVDHFFGIGNSRYNSIYSQLNLGSFDSFSQLFLRYGYLFTLLVICLILKNKNMFSIIILITFSSQTIWFLPFITPFYFYSFNRTR